MENFLEKNGLRWISDNSDYTFRELFAREKERETDLEKFEYIFALKGVLMIDDKDKFLGIGERNEFLEKVPEEVLKIVCITPTARESYEFENGLKLEIELFLEAYQNFIESDAIESIKGKMIQGYDIKKIFSPKETEEEFEVMLDKITEQIADKLEDKYYYLYNGLIEYSKSNEESEEEVL